MSLVVGFSRLQRGRKLGIGLTRENEMTDKPTIPVRVNGEALTVPEGLTLLGLLHQLGINEKRVAVEWNRQIVKPQLWAESLVGPGDEVEVVHFVGGGSGATIACG
jgi:thiamine biosynthesis protein ThiS